MNRTALAHIWPDGTECTPTDLEEYLQFMSDDYETTYDDDEESVQT